MSLQRLAIASVLAWFASVGTACSDVSPSLPDAGGTPASDAGIDDMDASAEPSDAGRQDAGRVDAGAPDAYVRLDSGWPTCSASDWRDVATGACHACPAAMLTCADLAFGVGSLASYDPSTQIFTVPVQPGHAEVVSGAMSVTTYDASSELTREVSTPIAVEGNVIHADFSAYIGSTVVQIYNASLTLEDRCGTTSEVPFAFDVNRVDAGVSIGRFNCPD